MRDMRKNSRTGCVASAVESRILVIETEADTQHQIVRITEILQIVKAHTTRAAGSVCFQRNTLVDLCGRHTSGCTDTVTDVK